jgi:hypothetical protein
MPANPRPRPERRWQEEFAAAVIRPLVLALAFACALVMPAGAAPDFETDTLAIRSRDGTVHAFTVELALTPQQQAFGLMFRRELAPDRGMLFLYDRLADHTMWMRNTLIPLDMLFIKPDGRVVHIAERTVPRSTTEISAGERVQAVLELRGGTAERLGIEPGATVLYPAFGTAR